MDGQIGMEKEEWSTSKLDKYINCPQNIEGPMETDTPTTSNQPANTAQIADRSILGPNNQTEEEKGLQEDFEMGEEKFMQKKRR